MNETKIEAKGLLIFYLNVGQMPPFKAEKYLKNMQERFSDTRFLLPSDVCVFWVPIRPPENTKIEYIAFQDYDAYRMERLAKRLRMWEEIWKKELAKEEEPETAPRSTFLDKLKFWRSPSVTK